MQDGVIQKDEFMQALFNTSPGQLNLFADRVWPYTLHAPLSQSGNLASAPLFIFMHRAGFK